MGGADEVALHPERFRVHRACRDVIFNEEHLAAGRWIESRAPVHSWRTLPPTTGAIGTPDDRRTKGENRVGRAGFNTETAPWGRRRSFPDGKIPLQDDRRKLNQNKDLPVELARLMALSYSPSREDSIS
jgi:hypothetical protein